MAIIPENWGAGGVPLTPYGTSSQATLAAFARDVADDLAALRNSIIAITAKLDLDTGVADEDYTDENPAAMATQKE